MLNNLGLGFVFTASNLASGTIEHLRGELAGLGGQSRTAGLAMKAGFGLAAAGVIPLAAGVGGLAAALSLAEAAGEFQVEIQRVGNIANATGDDLEKFRNAAIEAGLSSRFDPTEATQGLQALASQGFNASQSVGLLNQALALSAAGGIGIEQSSATMAAAIKAFGDRAGDTATIVDRLLKVSDATSLEAGDLQNAIGTVARGATAAGQGLDEMLIAMGLVRNTGVDASVAASSVSAALLEMGRNATKIQGDLGVSVTKTDGSFRDFLDVATEAAAALQTKYPNAAERAAKASELFGRFGLTAISGIGQQITDMVGTGEGQFATMELAVTSLRKTMQSAAGTAEMFSGRLLDTFSGQEDALKASAKTLAIVLGEPFAKVFKPIVGGLVFVVRTFARLFNSLSDRAKVVAAGIFTAVSAFLALGGGMMVVSGLIVAVLPFALAFLKVFVLMALAMAPVILGAVAVAGGIALVAIAIQKNLGGAGDKFREMMMSIHRAWDGLKQLFTEGGFTGPLRVILDKAENQGIRRFVIAVFMMWHRLKAFGTGFVEGFKTSFAALAGPFRGMIAAFERLGHALGFVSENKNAVQSAIPSARFAEAGAKIATILGNVIEVVINGATNVAEFFTSFVGGFREAWKFVSPIFDAIGVVIADTVDQFGQLFAELGVESANGGDKAKTFGEVFGVVASVVVGAIGSMVGGILGLVNIGVRAARFLVEAFHTVGDFMSILAIRVAETFMNVVDQVRNAIDMLLAFLASIVAKIPPSLRPAGLDQVLAAGAGAEDRIAGRNAQIGVRSAVAGTAVAEVQAQRSIQDAAVTRSEATSRNQVRDTVNAIEARRIVNQVILTVDGAVLARHTAEADRRETARGFVPAPVESGT